GSVAGLTERAWPWCFLVLSYFVVQMFAIKTGISCPSLSEFRVCRGYRAARQSGHSQTDGCDGVVPRPRKAWLPRARAVPQRWHWQGLLTITSCHASTCARGSSLSATASAAA